MRVQVYRNLHKNCYSVRCKKTRKVIMHLNEVTLFNVEFKVSQKGRERVLRERKKNVHAVIEGEIFFNPRGERTFKGIATYNPYLMDSFRIGNKPVFNARLVKLNNNFKAEVYE